MFWYFGTFTKPNDVPTCLSFATDSFRTRGLNVFVQPNGFFTAGGAPDSSVIVQVTCAPQGGNTWMVVTAFSDDNNLAQTTQHNVQSDIQGEVTID
jgi:hypothetical protein